MDGTAEAPCRFMEVSSKVSFRRSHKTRKPMPRGKKREGGREREGERVPETEDFLLEKPEMLVKFIGVFSAISARFQNRTRPLKHV